jgi:glycosyltransferase involved in cell wall biosynthesis
VPTPVVPVLFDAQPLSPAVSGSGTGTYLRDLLSALSKRDDVAVSAFCQPGASFGPAVRTLPLSRRARRPRLALMEHSTRLPLDVRRHRPEGGVFHNPSFHAPPGLPSPWVQTLHDVIPLQFDHPDLTALRARWKRFGPRYRRASAVIAISQHAAHDGVEVLGLDPARVHVALHGVSTTCVPSPSGPADPPYLLVVSEYSKRKGFAEAFAVLDALADAGYPHHLVVSGQVHEDRAAELDTLRAAARHSDRIEIRGFVDDLVGLYQGASAFLMSSRYEGFGLPALEAMACGVPVVAFSNSAVTEVVEGGGQLVPDGDVEAMVAAVRTVLDSPGAWSEWRERGLAHASTFTWARSAAIHAEVYRSVAEGASWVD